MENMKIMDPFLLFLFIDSFELDEGDQAFAMSPTRQTLFKLLDDENIRGACRGILLRINTSGGESAGKEELYADLESCSKAGIPIVVSISTQAISSGFYVSLVGDRVFALGNSSVGGLGASLVFPRESSYRVLVSSAPLKDTYLGDREPTSEEKDVMARYIQDVHDHFVKKVLERRPGVGERIGELVTGNIFTGRQALALGLVDELGGLREALGYLRNKSGITRILESDDIVGFEDSPEPSDAEHFGSGNPVGEGVKEEA